MTKLKIFAELAILVLLIQITAPPAAHAHKLNVAGFLVPVAALVGIIAYFLWRQLKRRNSVSANDDQRSAP